MSTAIPLCNASPLAPISIRAGAAAHGRRLRRLGPERVILPSTTWPTRGRLSAFWMPSAAHVWPSAFSCPSRRRVSMGHRS